jgi:hypothetical protein
MKEPSLEAYTERQLAEGEKLPENLSSISHDIEVVEGLRLDQRISQNLEVADGIENKTDARFCVTGSNGMYLLLNQLRNEGENLMILEERIAGGKNDFDIGFHKSDVQKAMTDFGWDEKTKELMRGHVGESKEMVDVMTRTELPHFPWQSVEINGRRILVPTAEEMIFEKMQVLIDPGTEDGEAKLREVKWGVDIKLLKAFLMIQNQWTEEELNQNLEVQWKEYLQDSRYGDVDGLVRKMEGGQKAEDIIGKFLEERLGRKIGTVSEELSELSSGKRPELISQLLDSATPSEFERNLKSFIDSARGSSALYYPEASARASLEYGKLLADRPASN